MAQINKGVSLITQADPVSQGTPISEEQYQATMQTPIYETVFDEAAYNAFVAEQQRLLEQNILAQREAREKLLAQQEKSRAAKAAAREKRFGAFETDAFLARGTQTRRAKVEQGRAGRLVGAANLELRRYAEQETARVRAETEAARDRFTKRVLIGYQTGSAPTGEQTGMSSAQLMQAQGKYLYGPTPTTYPSDEGRPAFLKPGYKYENGKIVWEDRGAGQYFNLKTNEGASFTKDPGPEYEKLSYDQAKQLKFVYTKKATPQNVFQEAIKQAELKQLQAKAQDLKYQIQQIQFKQDETKLLGTSVEQLKRQNDLIKQKNYAALGLESSFKIGTPSKEDLQKKANLQSELFKTQQQIKIINFENELSNTEKSISVDSFNKTLKKDYDTFVKKMEFEYGSQESQEKTKEQYEKELKEAYSINPEKITTDTAIGAGIGGTIGFLSGGPVTAAGGAATLAALTAAGEVSRSATFNILGDLEKNYGEENVEAFYPAVPSLQKFVEKGVLIQTGKENLISEKNILSTFGKTEKPFTNYLIDESFFVEGKKENIADFVGLTVFFGGEKVAQKTIGKIVESNTARLYTKALGFKQIEIKGVPALIKKGEKFTDIFVADIHKNPILGDIPEKELRSLLKIGSGEKIRIGTVMGEFPGFNPKLGDKYIATQNVESKWPWGTPQYDPLYGQPGIKWKTLFSKQFGPGLSGVKGYGEKAKIVFRKPKAFGLTFVEEVYDPLTLSKELDRLQKVYISGSKISKGGTYIPITKEAKKALGEAQRIFSGKVYSGKFVEPIENLFKGVKEPQASLQKQGFMLNTTQKIRGSVLKFKEFYGSPYFYDKLTLPGKKIFEGIEKAESVAGGIMRKTNFTKRLEKLYQDIGLGRDYKQISLFGVNASVPSGRPPKETKILPRDTARYLEVKTEKGVRKYKLFEEQNKMFGTGGGALDPVYNPDYYKNSKIGLKGGRIQLAGGSETVDKELMEEIGAKALFKRRLPITAKGEPYLSKQGMYFQDTTKNVFLVKGVLRIKKSGGTHAGEILSEKWFSAAEVEASPLTGKLTKEIVRKAERIFEKEAALPLGKKIKSYSKDILTQFKAKTKLGPSIDSGKYGDYYFDNSEYVSPSRFVPPFWKNYVSDNEGKYEYSVEKYSNEYFKKFGKEPKNDRYYEKETYVQPAIYYPQKINYYDSKSYSEVIYAPRKYAYVEYKSPTYKTPEYKMPSYKVPEYKIPPYKTPEYKIPPYKTPEYKIPPYKVPEYKIPPYEPPPYTQPPTRTPPGIPLTKRRITQQAKKFNARNKLFDVFVRKKGKVEIVGKALPRNLALYKGLSKADISTSRTIILKPAGFGRVKDIKGLPINLTKRFRLPTTKSRLRKLGDEVFVEKTKYAIGSLEEKKGIPGKAADLRRAGLLNKKPILNF